MTDPFDQPDAAHREELVAYLDGELSPEEARAVEQRLARDEALRREMQGFDRAWSALDELPRATVDDSFTKTTIEMVTLAAQRDVAELTQALPARRRKRGWWIAGITAVAATLGFALARVVLDQSNRVLLANLPVVQHLDAYSQNISVPLLQRLQTNADEMLRPYEDDTLEQQVENLQKISAATISERRDIISEMTDAEKAALSANLMRFQTLSSANQEQLIKLHEQIRSDSNAKELQRTMLANWAWTTDYVPEAAEQADLRSETNVKERIALMSQIELDRRSDRQIRFSKEELAEVRGVLQQYENNPQLIKLSEEFREKSRGGKDWERWRMNRPIPFPRAVLLAAVPRDRVQDPSVVQLQQDLRTQLLSALSEDTRRKIAERVQRDPRQQEDILRGAVWQAAFAVFDPSEAELEEFMASSEAIDRTDLQRLLTMPRQDMQRELKRLYVEDQLGVELPEFWRRRGPSFRDGRFMRGGRFGDPRGPDDRGPGPLRPNGPHRGPPEGPPREGPPGGGDRPFLPPPNDGQRPPPPPPEEAAI